LFSAGKPATEGIDAKLRIAELLGIEIDCLDKFRERMGL
jgi:hypothetical protein